MEKIIRINTVQEKNTRTVLIISCSFLDAKYESGFHIALSYHFWKICN